MLLGVGCNEPRTCPETEAFVDVGTTHITGNHAAPCEGETDCVRIEDDLICSDRQVALGGCGRAVLATREDEARVALSAFRDEVCSTPRESCSRDVDCGEGIPVCVNGLCVLEN